MRSFLQHAEARSESDKGVQTWVKQVRDVSYDTEDILEEFLLRLSPPQGSGFFHSLRKLQPRNDPPLASLFLDEADVVGIENPKSVLISWLVGREKNLTALSVVGMGGVGKTTLVKKVYDSQVVKKYFTAMLG
ncbi:putative disease resistance protein [Camellia lanceoleosa]|uniref:Disease resistance protein n=1 Tax=Camellia lanceoleosa TaxID=1840588 RepID=A0ACC0G8Q7_9ERIC|nr:putative disease resistance protein [Camellia lanceoleosa]